MAQGQLLTPTSDPPLGLVSMRAGSRATVASPGMERSEKQTHGSFLMPPAMGRPAHRVCDTHPRAPRAPASAHSGHPQLHASLLKGGRRACCSAELFSEAARFHLAERMSGRGGGGTLETVF